MDVDSWREREMQFPKNKLRFSRLVDGKTAPEGFLVLDLKGLDLDGVTSLSIDLTQVDALRAAGDQQSLEKERIKGLFGE
jgi:hypothetical protein